MQRRRGAMAASALALAGLLVLLAPSGAGAYDLLAQFGSDGPEAGQFDEPYGVAVAPNGHLWVSEEEGNRLSEFAPDGAFIKAVGWDVAPGGGTGFEQCTAATGCQRGADGGGAGQVSWYEVISAMPTGEIVGPNEENNRIDVFSPTGEFVRAIGFDTIPGGGAGLEICTAETSCQEGADGDAAGQLNNPTGVAVTPDGRGIWIADFSNQRISEYRLTGEFVRSFGHDVIPGGGTGLEMCTSATGCKAGTSGGAAGQFENPFDVEVAPDGTLLVTDNGAARLSYFTSEGEFLRAVGWDVIPGNPETAFEVCTNATGCQAGLAGGGAGQLDNDLGVATDASGAAYVADGGSGERVNLFAPDGSFEHAFGWDTVPGNGETAFEFCTAASGCKVGVAGAGLGQFDFPLGVDVDCRDRLYVANAHTSMVQIFGEPGTAAPPCPAELGRVKRNKRKGTAKLTVEVPAAGLIALTGSGLRKQAAELDAPATLKLSIKPKGKAKRKLAKRGKAKVRARVSYTPPAGKPVEATKRIKLKRKLRR